MMSSGNQGTNNFDQEKVWESWNLKYNDNGKYYRYLYQFMGKHWND